MRPIGRQTIIIASCLISLVVSSVFLVWKESSMRHPSQGKDWWAISFTDPLSSGNIDAVIENNSSQDSFEYEIIIDGMSVDHENIDVPKGSSASIVPDRTRREEEKVRIEVRDAKGDKKVIQKK